MINLCLESSFWIIKLLKKHYIWDWKKIRGGRNYIERNKSLGEKYKTGEIFQRKKKMLEADEKFREIQKFKNRKIKLQI